MVESMATDPLSSGLLMTSSGPTQPSEPAPDTRGALRRWLAVPRPLAVWATAALLALQGLALVVIALVGASDLLPGRERVLGVAVALTLSAAGAAWLLLASAYALTLGRSWVRGPVITVQVLAALVGVNFVQGGATALGLLLVVVPVLTLVGLLCGPVSRFTGRRTYSLDQD